MSEDIKLTKLASCAGCGAKVGAGTLSRLLQDLPVQKDERLLVGFDKSDDAAVYKINDDTAIIQTIDFFPPIADDPNLFGQIAACNAISDIYAMGGEPKLAMNVMTIENSMTKETIHEILRGGYEKAYEAGVLITGGHTIHDTEPKYGLSVTGFVHPDKVIRNSTAREGDVLILTKPLGIGILTTAAKAGMISSDVEKRIYAQMTFLNKTARDIMVKYNIHSCTDVTGFSLLGHGCEMALGSNVSIHLNTSAIPYHPEAFEMAEMGFIPAGAYRNREFAQSHVTVENGIPLALEDILYDPQTSGGLLIAVSPDDAAALLNELQSSLEVAREIGYVSAKGDCAIYLHR